MSADDATQTTTDHASDGSRPPFEDHDFGGEQSHEPTPDHVAPYSSRDDEAPRTGPVDIPDHVQPYSSRD